MSESSHKGVVYTKRWVAQLVLDLAGYEGGSILHRSIVEPSCGEGAFLAEISARIGRAACARGTWEGLEHCVRAYEMDAESANRSKKTIAKELAAAGCPDSTAHLLAKLWVHCDDFLTADVPPCDWVVGNPPYVRASEIDKDKRSQYVKTLSSMTYGCDLYVGFFDKSLSLLTEGGSLCFICADRWLQNSYGRKLREKVNGSARLFEPSYNLSLLVRMHGVDAFEGSVDAYPAITLIKRETQNDVLRFVSCNPSFCEKDVSILKDRLENEDAENNDDDAFATCVIGKPKDGAVVPLGDAPSVQFISRINQTYPLLEQSAHIGIGIATGCDEIFLTDDDQLVEPDRLMPIFYMRDYRRGNPDRKRWLVNPWNAEGNLVNLDDYPRTKAYFEKNRERLERRHVAKSKAHEWYRTIDKLKPGLENESLLLMPDMATMPDPVLSKGKYPHHNCYWISSDVWNLEVLGGLLMSDSVRSIVSTLGVKMRGGTLRFQAQYLRLLHVPDYEGLNEQVREGLAEAFKTRDRKKASHYAMLAYER